MFSNQKGKHFIFIGTFFSWKVKFSNVGEYKIKDIDLSLLSVYTPNSVVIKCLR